MSLADESLAELFEQYKDEVRETIGTLDSELVAVEQDPGASEVIFSIFRHLHSLKGSSKMFNVDNIGHIAHKLEDLMQLIDRDNSILSRKPQIVDLLFRGNDIFRDIISRLEHDISFINLTQEHAQFIEEINRQLEQISGKESGLLQSARDLLDELENLTPMLEDFEIDGLRRAMKELSDSISLADLEGASEEILYTYQGKDVTGRVKVYEEILPRFKAGTHTDEDVQTFFANAEGLLQDLFEVAEESVMTMLGELNDGLDMYNEKSLEIDDMIVEFFSLLITDLKGEFKTEAVASSPEPDEKTPEAEVGKIVKEKKEKAAPVPQSQAKTIRVDEGKIDLFLDSVGKLITQSEILNHLQFSFKGAGINPALVRDFAAVNRTISNDIVNLQKSIMEVRQVEMDNILKKFPRLVRDISHKMGKEVELRISGERVPIDKSLLDDVEQAMIHIIRNAIDHALESPEERMKNGKDRRGLIDVSVTQEEASILVEVKDDGRGIDFEHVRKKAVARGIVSREQAEAMSDQEAESLIFRSGLTTKEEATDISGRGVGLDVVLSNIKKWNGDVSLENRPGQGLAIQLRIPITNTLLTKEAILLKLGPTLFCLPLEYVVEIVTVPAAKLHQHKNQVIFQHRNQVITVVDIKAGLGLDPGREDEEIATFILLRGQFESRKAIRADEIVGQQKIVVKDFEIESFRKLPYFQGLTLLGDGRVVLILDAEMIVDR